MATFIEGLTQGLRSAYCAIGGLPPEWLVDIYRDLTPPAIVNLGSAINRSICNNAPDDNLEFPSSPLVGGQCAVSYNTQITYRLWAPGCTPTVIGPETFQNGVMGPLSFTTGNPDFWGANLCPGAPYETIRLVDGSGTGFVNQRGSAFGTELLSITATRVDGQPDDCGNLPAPLPPVAPITINVDINFEDGDENEFNLTVPVIFAPVYLAFDGSLRIPVTIGDLNFNAEIQLTPTFEVEISLPDGGFGGQPDDPELPPSGDPSLDEPDPPAGPDGNIVGVVVRSTRFGPVRATTIFQEGMPDILAPRIANVRFLCRFGGITAWTSDLPVKGVNEYIPCPSPFGAIDVIVVAETNWSTVSTAIRSRPPANFEP